MNYALRMTSVATFVAAATLSVDAIAQKQAPLFLATCQAIGVSTQEPIGDRDGHSYAVNQYSCQNKGGPFEGSIMTGTTIWEFDKANAAAVTGNGVIRKPGLSVIYVLTAGTNALTMTDGKITGFSGNAKGVYKVAAGTASSLAGKSFSSTFRSVGGGQFVIETTVD